MNKQKTLNLCSILMSLVCVFSIISGVVGFRDILSTKNEKMAEKEATLKQLSTLEEGVKKLESNRADYEAGKKKVADGEIEFAEGVKKLEAGQAEYEAGKAQLAKGQKEYDAGKVDLAKGQKEYDAGKAELAKAQKEYDAGMAQYKAGKAQYDAGLKALNAKTAEYQAGKAMLEAGKADYEAAKPYYLTLQPQYSAAKANEAAATAQVAEGMGKLQAGTIDQDTFNTQYGPYVDVLKVIQVVEGVEKYEAGLAGVAEYEKGKATLQASEKQLNAAKSQLDAGQKQLNAGKAKLDAAQKQLTAGKAKLKAAETQLATGKAKLAEAEIELANGKTALEDAKVQLKNGKEQLAEFEEGEKQIQAGYAVLAENVAVKAKIDKGMDPVAAAKAVIDEETVKGTKEVMARVYVISAIIIVAIVGAIASSMGINVAKTSDVAKLKNGFILGVIALVIAVLANIYGAMNGYSAYKFQMTAAILEVIVAIAFVASINQYKSTAK